LGCEDLFLSKALHVQLPVPEESFRLKSSTCDCRLPEINLFRLDTSEIIKPVLIRNSYEKTMI
jgi:hypothetical protein